MITRMRWWAWLLIGALAFYLLQGAHAMVNISAAHSQRWHTVIDISSGAALVLCLFAGVSSFFSARRQASFTTEALEGSAPNAPRLSWGHFELLAVEAFRRRGFQITERGSSSQDGSRNLQLQRGRQVFVAHCKAWKQKTVGMGAVRELYSMVIVSKATGGIVVTTGTFSQEARTFAAGRQIQLIDGPTLREMLRDAEGQLSMMHTIIPTDVVTS